MLSHAPRSDASKTRKRAEPEKSPVLHVNEYTDVSFYFNIIKY